MNRQEYKKDVLILNLCNKCRIRSNSNAVFLLFQDEIIELLQLLTSDKWNEAINCTKEVFVTSKNILNDVKDFTTQQVGNKEFLNRLVRKHNFKDHISIKSKLIATV